VYAVCKLNVHKRCAKNVANNCGINTKDMAKVLQELGISGDKFSTASKRKKAGCSTLLLMALILSVDFWLIEIWYVQQQRPFCGPILYSGGHS